MKIRIFKKYKLKVIKINGKHLKFFMMKKFIKEFNKNKINKLKEDNLLKEIILHRLI